LNRGKNINFQILIKFVSHIAGFCDFRNQMAFCFEKGLVDMDLSCVWMCYDGLQRNLVAKVDQLKCEHPEKV